MKPRKILSLLILTLAAISCRTHREAGTSTIEIAYHQGFTIRMDQSRPVPFANGGDLKRILTSSSVKCQAVVHSVTMLREEDAQMIWDGISGSGVKVLYFDIVTNGLGGPSAWHPRKVR